MSSSMWFKTDLRVDRPTEGRSFTDRNAVRAANSQLEHSPPIRRAGKTLRR